MKRLPVFFDPRMVVDVVFETPSPRKPGEVVAQWKERYPVDIKGFSPASVSDFYLAHDRGHVDGILSQRIDNGMETRHLEVLDSLP